MSRTVAELARHLNQQNAKKHNLPALLFMSDAKRLPDPSIIIHKIPRNSAIIIRGFSKADKEKTILKIKPVCKKHGIKILVSDDLKLAIKHHLDGVHFPEASLKSRYLNGKVLKPYPNFIYTTACHSVQALSYARKAGMDAGLLSPIFPTQSHPNAKTLGPLRAHLLSLKSSLPLYGLGGINKRTAQRLISSGFIGFAGVGNLI